METKPTPLSKTIETRTEFTTLTVGYYIPKSQASRSQASYQALLQAEQDYPDAKVERDEIRITGTEDWPEVWKVNLTISWVRHLQK